MFKILSTSSAADYEDGDFVPDTIKVPKKEKEKDDDVVADDVVVGEGDVPKQSTDEFISEMQELMTAIEAELDESYAFHAQIEEKVKETNTSKVDPSVLEYFKNLKI